MKNSDFKKMIDSLPEDRIMIRDHIFTLSIPSEGYKAEYDLIGLHKFVFEKDTKWESLKAIPEFSESVRFFKNLLNSIENSVDNKANGRVNNNNIISNLKRVNSHVLLPDSAKTLFLTHIYNTNKKYLRGAMAVISNSMEYNQFGSTDYIKGVFLASKFEVEDIDSLLRGEAEAKSFSQIKTEFDVERIQILNDFGSLVSSTKDKANNEIKNLKSLSDKWNLEYASQLEVLVTKVNSEIHKSNDAGINLLKKSLSKKMQLEQVYRENMRFQAPAEYWKERAIALNAEGKKFMRWLIALVSIGVLILFSLLWLTPENMLETIFSGSPAKAIRWSIIFITLISLLFVGIQAVKKAMFSSYHLARDAEEREKLTVFYLSLIKDSTITQEDRSLILQALFSRAETGMLKDDSSPSMPGIFDKIKG